MDALLSSCCLAAAAAAASSSRILGRSPSPSPPPPCFLSISAVIPEEKPSHDAVKPKHRAKTRFEEKRVIATPPVPPSRPQRRRVAAFCNAMDELINTFIDPPDLRPSVDPRHVLLDNFSSVGELPPTPCPVVRGAIPRCLAGGAYIRNGPNPQHFPRGPYHLFEGDGMLHAILLDPTGHEAILCSRYVHTYKYLLERDAGGPVVPNFISGFHGVAGLARTAVTALKVLTRQMSLAEGLGMANTSLAFFADRLYALCESDLPYAVRLDPTTGDIATAGRCDFNGRLYRCMTAHPKKDPSTGELFAFRYGLMLPFLTYFRFDPAGNKCGPDVPIFSARDPSLLHDFAITERYAVFAETQIVLKPIGMVLGGGALLGSEHRKVPRIGVLPRYATNESEMRWFEVPGFNMMHAINAWDDEEEDQLVLVAPNMLCTDHLLGNLHLVHSCVEMVRINLRTGILTRTPLSQGNFEFGVIHPGYVGRRNRYAYAGVADPMPKISGVVKLDFSIAGKGDCVVARRDFGPHCFGGEPFFVPESKEEEEEDEGYLVSYVHNEASGESRFVVMDASSPDLEIVAELLLPRRVPYGFHGLFLSQAELRSQQPF